MTNQSQQVPPVAQVSGSDERGVLETFVHEVALGVYKPEELRDKALLALKRFITVPNALPLHSSEVLYWTTVGWNSCRNTMLADAFQQIAASPSIVSSDEQKTLAYGVILPSGELSIRSRKETFESLGFKPEQIHPVGFITTASNAGEAAQGVDK